MREATSRPIHKESEHISSKILTIMNHVIVVLGFIVLPLGLVLHLLTCTWCNNVFLFDKIPVFNVLLMQQQIALSDLCLLELACVLTFIFRVGYVAIAHKSIITNHVSRIKESGREPRQSFIKLIIFFISMMFLILMMMFHVSRVSIDVASDPIMKTSFFSLLVIFFYIAPEIIIWMWYVVRRKDIG